MTEEKTKLAETEKKKTGAKEYSLFAQIFASVWIIVFPLFPDPEPVAFDDTTETVSMPLWYWQKIAEYKIEVDAIQSYFEKIRQLQK